jgi:hypothetical protein
MNQICTRDGSFDKAHVRRSLFAERKNAPGTAEMICRVLDKSDPCKDCCKRSREGDLNLEDR